ncbi:MAG: acylphosphatase [Candidatus Gracilibacteria bacterium]|jgi:acylphosphatase
MDQAIILVWGHVQGVFYRSSAKKKANTLNISGYAKNLSSGEVEILAQGQRENIEQFIEWCREGPSAANVDRVEVSWQPAGEILDHFDIK